MSSAAGSNTARRFAVGTQWGILSDELKSDGSHTSLQALLPTRFNSLFRSRQGSEKGTGPICAKHPPGRPGKLDLSPFPRLKTSAATRWRPVPRGDMTRKNRGLAPSG